MRLSIINRILSSFAIVSFAITISNSCLIAQGRTEAQTENIAIAESKMNFLGTSALGLLALAYPGENTFYFQLDYGRKIKNGDNLMLGAMVYQYRRPHSTPYNDESTYNGYVLSYGPVFAYQHFFWKNFFAMPIVNPLLMDYRRDNKEKINRGFMLLCAFRGGYTFDFKISSIPFYLEPSGEINFWPVNSNVPTDFKVLESNYKKYVFAPGINFGFKF
jgi:hypothetical protein